MIVLDANILIRAVLGRRVRRILDHYAGKNIEFFAPDVAYADAEKYLPALLKNTGRDSTDLPSALEYFQAIVKPVKREIYEPFESESRKRLHMRDEDDWPVLATAFALSVPLWTEDTDFFGTGIAVWTTNLVEIYLNALE